MGENPLYRDRKCPLWNILARSITVQQASFALAAAGGLDKSLPDGIDQELDPVNTLMTMIPIIFFDLKMILMGIVFKIIFLGRLFHLRLFSQFQR
ncbi:MAG: hypothetical protein Ct9H90mP30_6390 [Actinomycetota bacterium]|nr:MAG: hypothetical protein Ct9H90mP30_6390 [Actinomycetota bacterium]